MLLIVSEVSGFKSNDLIIEVLDTNYKAFYYFENPNSKTVTFNLPIGEYIILCDVEKLANHLRYVCPELPRKEKNIETPEKINISVLDNPNKASFENWSGNMLIDHSIWSKPIPQRRFVMGHELGHTYYFTEWKCDVFSAYGMLQMGYNPSQCFYANYFCLSDGQRERKIKLHNWLKKVKCYER